MTLYNSFNEFLEDISEDVLPNEATGFKDSIIWNKLFHFQKDAVLAIINKLEQYNGCILADSVGLGKTFTALQKVFAANRKNGKVRAESWWDNKAMNEDATIELKELFGKAKLFTHPKPSELIKHLLSIATEFSLDLPQLPMQ